MSAFAVSYAGGGRSEVDTVSLQEKTDQVERNATFWQRIQHKYSCCLVDFIVHFLCPTQKNEVAFNQPTTSPKSRDARRDKYQDSCLV
ncbi:hypothetical protein C0Q70_09539 [Pomacea canaliculata]|uniref:Uncharacterized protein n=1 Tax=Pomacea canaliculata TaxID=400727 RepID=A0A2T7PA21_POMCA|nr:hypothetical protein C0Q70_09539 [Pomacea canaliculata]